VHRTGDESAAGVYQLVSDFVFYRCYACFQVVDPVTRETVPRGTKGELCVRGYSVMLGYYKDPVATSEAIDSQGFMRTGDLASMNEEGYLNIVGRSKDMVRGALAPVHVHLLTISRTLRLICILFLSMSMRRVTSTVWANPGTL
jgi:hypothetical protein